MSSGANPSPFDACMKWICQESHPEHESPPQFAHDRTHPGPVSQQPDHVIPMDDHVQTTSNIQLVRKPTNEQSDAWKAFVKTLNALEMVAMVFPPLKSAISALIVAEQNQQEYDQMARDLTRLVQTLQTHLPESKPKRMPYSIENVARAIGEQVAHIKQQQEKSQPGQVVRATDNEIDIVGCYRRIEAIFRQLQTDVSLSVWDLTHDLWVDTRLKDLKPVHDARHNAGLSIKMQRRGCLAKTRVEILKETMSWTGNPTAAKIYWMNGMAGTGKTTIAYTLCDQLEESKQLGASFFCSRASPDCRNVNKIVPTIAYQLARYSNPYQNELCEVLTNNSDVAKREISIQFQKLIVNPLMKVKDAIPIDLVIVIDALDECEDIQGTQLMLELLFMHAMSLPVKFFVASRPEPSISSKISRSEDTYRLVLHLHDVEESLVQADIHTYLQDQLGSIEAKPAEIDSLTIRAGCLFIFAATVVRYIEPHDPAVNHRKRLMAMLGAHTTATGQAYRELDGLYRAILNQSLKEVKGDEAEWRRLVLQAVLVAKEPLTIPAITELIEAESEEDVQLALLPFQSLLRVSVDSKVVTALHASFPDFMFDPARSCHFHCDLSVQDAYMANRCFEIMKNSLRFNICNIETSFEPDKAISDLQTRITGLISSGVAYVSRYWGDHLGGAKFSDGLENMLDRFLRHRLLFWMEVLNLKDWIGFGASILLHALNFLPGDSQTDLRAMIQDSRNFITTYAASPASQSTPHIYISGLPHTPSHSRVREIYWPRSKGLFQTQGTAVKDRGDATLATWAVGSPVYTLALSKDGKQIASGSDHGKVSVWDANKGIRHVGPLSKHEGYVASVAFSPDGSRIASASKDRTICVSNAHTGDTLVGPLMGHTDRIYCLSFSSDGAVLASASKDHTIRVWDPLTGAQVGTELRGHERGVSGVVFTSDGAHIISCSHDHTVRVWDWKTGVPVKGPFEGHRDYVTCIALSSDDSLIASGSADQTVWVWSIEQGKKIVGPLNGHTSWVVSVAFSPDGKRIASGSRDQTIRVWSSDTGNPIAGPFTGHEDWVFSVLFSRDGTQLISGSLDGTIRVWDANPSRSNGADMVSSGHTAAISAIVISPDGTRVISGSYDHTICIWDMHDGTLILGPLTGHTDWVTSLACTHDSTCIISGSWDYTVRTWDAHTGLTLPDPFARHDNFVRAVAASPDGSLIASGVDNGSVKIWNRHDGIQVGDPPAHHTGRVGSVAFSSNSAYLASGSGDKSVCLWDANTGSLVWRSKEQSSSVMSVGLSTNGKTIIACLRDGIVPLDAGTGTCTVPSSSWEGSASRKWRDFSLTNTRIAAVADNGTLCLWDAESRTILAALPEGAVSQPSAVAIAPDSRRIVSGSLNSTVQFWDVDGIEDLERQGINSWAGHEDGWIRDSGSQLILWLPATLKHTIPSPESRRYSLSIRSKASSQIQFSSLIYGSHWEDCYTAPPDSDAFDVWCVSSRFMS